MKLANRFSLLRARSMRARMTLSFTASIAVLLLLACGGIIGFSVHSARRSADALLTTAIGEVQYELSHGEHSLDNPGAFVREESDEFRANNLVLLVVDEKGHVVARSHRRAPSWPLQDDDWRVATVQSGARTVVIGLPWKDNEHGLREQALALLGLSTLGILAAAAGAWLLVGRTLAPIGSLSRQAHTAGENTPHDRGPRALDGLSLTAPSQDAEVVDLVTTLNDLLARVAAMSASRGRFYAAASHELRTPLQALLGHLEVALSRPRTAAEYRATLEEAHAQTRRLTSLVQALLTLNQLDATPTPPPCEPLDLAAVCERILGQLQPLIAERGLQVRADLQDVETTAPPAHVEMLLRNLLENAVKYATPHGQVGVRLCGGAVFGSQAASQSPVLEICNECRPDPNSADDSHLAWDTEKWFEPFFRPDAARHSETGGNGLGLAICKAIALVNGWSLTLRGDATTVQATVLFGAPAISGS
ncbi:MAG: ATP-binding protein [Armatimonadota bacterium]|nr:ATP-binding protein [Armatimonadota bacterium]